MWCSHRRGVSLPILSLAALAAALIGCRTTYDFKGALIALPAAQEQLKHAANVDVILVDEVRGTVFPKELLIGARTHAIVWVSAGKRLSVTFDNSKINPQCDQTVAICVLGPLDLPMGPYTYGGQVWDTQGVSHALEPKIEIVR